ncbi:hypothetical protein Agub_g13880 [Astrephomene gubernaculifera]|uniref:Uncharacterized protein n=1 Tax=Astrephomene gubernaculifera TaxID=47775 RepID=A0AAD3HSN3_9CHLO|nr:hypothetical protein Agub_g13880 [Astrephomene gubernaculifera]
MHSPMFAENRQEHLIQLLCPTRLLVAALLFITQSAAMEGVIGLTNGSATMVEQHHGSLRQGRGHSQHQELMRTRCSVLERQYVPSPLEKNWVDSAAKWKSDGNGDVHNTTQYCQLMIETAPEIQKMLGLIASLMKTNTSLSREPDADAVLSYITTKVKCGTHEIVRKEHIESLVGALRHPFSIKCPDEFTSRLPPASDIMDLSYVLLAGGSDHKGPMGRSRYYLDAGAGIGYKKNPDQHWTIESYAARGNQLDRAVFWEASPATGDVVLADVPPHLFPAFTFYNIPVPRDLSDQRNILNVVTRLAKPWDFVSVKLDIDAPEVEDEWAQAILGDGPTGQQRSKYAELIDELFWEHHFDLKPLRDCCWGDKVDSTRQLADSMRLFQQLRQLGIRAHYWP